MHNQFDVVGESPQYNRNKRRRFRRQQWNALSLIPDLKSGEPEAIEVSNLQRKRLIQGNGSDCSSKEDMSIKRELDTSTDVPKDTVHAKYENGFPNIKKQEHGNTIKLSSLALPPPPQSWLNPNQTGDFRNPTFFGNQTWSSGVPYQNHPEWNAPRQSHGNFANPPLNTMKQGHFPVPTGHPPAPQFRSTWESYLKPLQESSNRINVIERFWNTKYIHHK